jgi:hypothetical protein
VQQHLARFLREQGQRLLATTSSNQRAQREVQRSLSRLASGRVGGARTAAMSGGAWWYTAQTRGATNNHSLRYLCLRLLLGS